MKVPCIPGGKYSRPVANLKAVSTDEHLYDELKLLKKEVAQLTEERNCLVPQSYGVSLSQLKGADLWQVYCVAMPKLRQESAKKYKTLTRASLR